MGRRVKRKRKEPPIPNRLPRHMRSTKAHLRSELGHWEADLMHFQVKERLCSRALTDGHNS